MYLFNIFLQQSTDNRIFNIDIYRNDIHRNYIDKVIDIITIIVKDILKLSLCKMNSKKDFKYRVEIRIE